MANSSQPTSEVIRGYALEKQEAGPSCVAGEALVTLVNTERHAEQKAIQDRERLMKWYNQLSSNKWETE